MAEPLPTTKEDGASSKETAAHEQLQPLPSEEPKFKPFRFRDLPREIRDKIYSLSIDTLPNDWEPYVGEIKDSNSHLNLKQHPMARVSREVRREALAALFAASVFRVRVSHHGDTAGRAWLRSQDDVAISSMRKFIFRHASWRDHGGEWHEAEIHVDVVKATVKLDQTMYSCCKECGELQVVQKIVEKLQAMVDALVPVEGRKRLSKKTLGRMIAVASHMCRPDGDEEIPEWMALK